MSKPHLTTNTASETCAPALPDHAVVVTRETSVEEQRPVSMAATAEGLGQRVIERLRWRDFGRSDDPRKWPAILNPSKGD